DASELRALRADLLDVHRELTRVRGQNEQLVLSNRDLSGLLTASAQRTRELVKMIVAFRCRLDSADSASALRSIEEILINVIGTEDFAVMLLTDQASMRAVAGMGPAVARARETPPTLQEVTDAG